jgi:hypothetical protein
MIANGKHRVNTNRSVPTVEALAQQSGTSSIMGNRTTW